MHTQLTRAFYVLLLIIVASGADAQRWERVGQLMGREFYGGSVSPRGDIYVISHGLHCSSDGGNVWRRKVPGLSVSFNSLTSDLVWIQDTVFVATAGLLLRSRDKGNHWDTITTVGSDATISSGQQVIAVSKNNSVITSTDGGVSWSEPSVFGTKVSNVHVDGKGNVYAMTTERVQRSSNFGKDWVAVAGLPVNQLTSAFCSPHNSCTIAALNDLVYRSLDNGATWQQLYKTESAIFSAASLSRDTIFLQTSAGIIHRSTNAGATWSVYSTRFEKAEYKLRFFCGASSLFMLINDSVLRHQVNTSADFWERLLIPNATVRGLVAAPSGFIHGVLAYPVSSYARMITFDGKDWIPSGGMPIATPFAVDSTGAVCAVFDKAFQRSTNNGASWTSETVASFNVPFTIATTKRSIFLASRYGVHRSTNRGATFTIENAGLETKKDSIRTVAATDSVIYIGGTLMYFRSTDNGDTWHAPEFPFIIGSGLLRTISCAGSKVVFGIDQTGVYFSNDYGLFWENNSEGLPGGIIHDLELTPSGIVFAVTDKGIYEYAPLTKTWKDANDGILGGHVTSITLSADGRIYAGTTGDGVYRSTATFGSWSRNVKQTSVPRGLVYPNPASSQIRIVPPRQKDFFVSLYNMLGLRVLDVQGSDLLNVAGLPNGQYLVRVAAGDTVQTQPLIVAH